MQKDKERKEALVRIGVLIISGVITYVWASLAWVLMVLHWIIALIGGKRSKGIAEFLEYWNTQVYRILKYLSGMTNERPFPFTGLQKISKFERLMPVTAPPAKTAKKKKK